VLIDAAKRSDVTTSTEGLLIKKRKSRKALEIRAWRAARTPLLHHIRSFRVKVTYKKLFRVAPLHSSAQQMGKQCQPGRLLPLVGRPVGRVLRGPLALCRVIWLICGPCSRPHSPYCLRLRQTQPRRRYLRSNKTHHTRGGLTLVVVHLHLAVCAALGLLVVLLLLRRRLAQRGAPAAHVAGLALGAGPVLAHLLEHQVPHLCNQRRHKHRDYRPLRAADRTRWQAIPTSASDISPLPAARLSKSKSNSRSHTGSAIWPWKSCGGQTHIDQSQRVHRQRQAGG
jgi:hypothetical protein